MIIPMPCGGNIDMELKELRPDAEMSCSKGCVHDFKEIHAAAAEVLIKRRAAGSLKKLFNPRILLNPTFGLCAAGLIVGFVEIDAEGTASFFGYKYKLGFFNFMNRDWSVGHSMQAGLFILYVIIYVIIYRLEKGRDIPEDGETCAEGQPGLSGASSAAENNQKILQIDDNLENMKGVKAVLERSFPGASVFMATSGAEGIALALAEAPDVILLNIIMPETDGIEVCRRLKAEDRLKAIPVLFMTTDKTDKESRAKALEAGGCGFLRKPVEMEKLVEQVRALAKLKEKKQQTGDMEDAAETSGNLKTYFNPYVIVLVSVSPIVISMLANNISDFFGEPLLEGSHPNIPIIGGLLSVMGGLGLASIITIPAGAVALLVYFILHFTGRLKK